MFFYAIILAAIALELSAFQQPDSSIQQISIRPPYGARVIGANRRAKTTDPIEKANIRDDSRITVIQKFAETTPVPWKYVNKRKSKFHPASGAYPVYYATARANGSFKGNRIWLLSVEWLPSAACHKSNSLDAAHEQKFSFNSVRPILL